MEDLKQIRTKIDKTDDELKDIFIQRLELMKDVAEAKKNADSQITDTNRENEIVYRLTENLSDKYARYIKELYSVVFSTSKAYQCELLGKSSKVVDEIKEIIQNGQKKAPARAAVACQGVKGAYGGAAAKKLFSICDVTYFKNFEGVFSAVESGLCEYGVLPIENSTAGSVSEVYDLMKKHDFHIVRAVRLNIEHCIAGVNGATLKDIKKVVSHPQAIRQCAKFIKEHKLETEEDVNTAIAAEKVAKLNDKSVAVLCSNECAEVYGLNVLERGVQDETNNYTRFICISKNMEIFAGSDKISIMTALPHKPGGLVAILNRFAASGLNLTKIESRPVPNTDFEFMFYFDFEGLANDPEVLSLIASLERSSDKFVFLGAYKEIL